MLNIPSVLSLLATFSMMLMLGCDRSSPTSDEAPKEQGELAQAQAVESSPNSAKKKTEAASQPKVEAKSAPKVDLKGSAYKASESLMQFASSSTAQLLKNQAKPENLFYSPYSLYVALGMTYAGAAGKTEEQMKSVLSFTQHQDVAALTEAIKPPLMNQEQPPLGDVMTLNVANKLWVSKKIEAAPAFLETTKTHYGALPEAADFDQAEEARQKINAWVAGATQDKIKELIPKNVLNAFTRLVLVNAVYFKASWVYKFEESQTKEKPFVSMGKTSKVPMMHLRQSLPYHEVKGMAQVALLPYLGGSEMVVILPSPTQFEAVQNKLKEGGLDTFLKPTSEVKYQELDLELPKFKTRSKFELSKTMKTLGMSDAFNSKLADFSKMVKKVEPTGLFIGSIIQETFVSVDEKGTEAAAATAVMMTTEGAMAPAKPVQMHVNRPFFVVIRHGKTNTPLFVGQIVQP